MTQYAIPESITLTLSDGFNTIQIAVSYIILGEPPSFANMLDPVLVKAGRGPVQAILPQAVSANSSLNVTIAATFAPAVPQHCSFAFQPANQQFTLQCDSAASPTTVTANITLSDGW